MENSVGLCLLKYIILHIIPEFESNATRYYWGLLGGDAEIALASSRRPALSLTGSSTLPSAWETAVLPWHCSLRKDIAFSFRHLGCNWTSFFKLLFSQPRETGNFKACSIWPTLNVSFRIWRTAFYSSSLSTGCRGDSWGDTCNAAGIYIWLNEGIHKADVFIISLANHLWFTLQ